MEKKKKEFYRWVWFCRWVHKDGNRWVGLVLPSVGLIFVGDFTSWVRFCRGCSSSLWVWVCVSHSFFFVLLFRFWCWEFDVLFMYSLETMKGLSSLEHIDRWISTSTRTHSSKKHTKANNSFNYKTGLQRAYIFLLILVVWHWQILDGWQVSKSL